MSLEGRWSRTLLERTNWSDDFSTEDHVDQGFFSDHRTLASERSHVELIPHAGSNDRPVSDQSDIFWSSTLALHRHSSIDGAYESKHSSDSHECSISLSQFQFIEVFSISSAVPAIPPSSNASRCDVMTSKGRLLISFSSIMLFLASSDAMHEHSTTMMSNQDLVHSFEHPLFDHLLECKIMSEGERERSERSIDI